MPATRLPAVSVDFSLEQRHYAWFEGSLWSKRVVPIGSLDFVEEARDNEAKLDRSWTLDCAALRHRVTMMDLRNSDVRALATPVQPLPLTAPVVVGFSRAAMLTSKVSHE